MNEVKFSSLAAEDKYHILNYLSENRNIPHCCFEITQAVQHQNKAIRKPSYPAPFTHCGTAGGLLSRPGVYTRLMTIFLLQALRIRIYYLLRP